MCFNDEVVALVRAGIPLGPSLVSASNRRLPSALVEVERAVGTRLELGESLESILSDDATPFPPVYRAVVLAGLRSDNLGAALESMASSLRRTVNLRRLIVQSLAYPVTVVVLACLLFAVCIQPVFQSLLVSIELQGVAVPAWMTTALRFLADYGRLLVQIPLMLLAGCLLLTLLGRWLPGGRLSGRGRLEGWLRFFPTAHRIIQDGRLATFAEMLQLLTRHHIPIHDGLPLAAQASDAPKLVEAASHLAGEVRRRARTAANDDATAGIPSLMRLVLFDSDNTEQLSDSLQRLGNAYFRSATIAAQRFQLSFPVLATLLVGGLTTAAYALTLLAPWFTFLSRLGAPLP